MPPKKKVESSGKEPTVDNSGRVTDTRRQKRPRKYHEGTELKKPRAKPKVHAVEAAPAEPLDLEVHKLPTDTVHTLAKRSKFHEDNVFPNSNGPSRCIFNGPSGSGKTNFALSLLTDARQMRGYFEKIIVFCPSAELQSDYAHLESCYKVPEELQIVEFSPAAVQAHWDEAKTIFKKAKDAKLPLPMTLFLMDDLINTPNFDKCASTLMTKSRHSGISVWVITQGFMTLSRLMRLQASNVFAFGPTESEIQRLAADCTNAICDEQQADAIIRFAIKDDRYKPFHFNRHAPLHTQYRRGLTTIYELADPADGIHSEPKHKAEATSVANPEAEAGDLKEDEY